MLNKEGIATEFVFKTARSSGAGGQNVNKVESKVTLLWDVAGSAYITPAQKDLLLERLKNRISKDGLLQIESSEDRSQLRNKELAIKRFFGLLETSLVVNKKRVATKIPKSKVIERLDRKKKHSQKKSFRGRINLD